MIVVVRDSALHTADAVPFEDLAYPQNPYLLPTKISIDREGCVSLRPPTEEGQVVADLKLALMQANPSHGDPSARLTHPSATRTDAAVYLGLVLREVKRWFAEAKGLIYQDMKLIWWLNIGLPSRSYDNLALCQVFRTVALAAWQLACHSGAITQELARQAVLQAWQRINEQSPGAVDDDIHPERVCVIPEIIAEVTGYARSPLRREGMYLIMDVGASTLDISTFILRQSEGEDAYSILTAEVEKLGVLKLHQRRLQVARLSEERRDNLSGAGDGVTPIPEPEDYILNPQQVELAEVDKTFQNDCAALIRRVVYETKRHRNPLASAWDCGLPVFISGGGAQMSLYREVLELAEKMLTRVILWAEFQQMALAKPSDLEAPGFECRYHRLAVAYGLSFSSLDIGHITPPREIPDISRNLVVLDVPRRYVSKDMV